jgi:methionyl-tRNA formyltransferase
MQGQEVPLTSRPSIFQQIGHLPAQAGWSVVIERAVRALAPWPGVWTEVEIRDKGQGTAGIKKRVKILSCHVSHVSYLVIDTVQVEGKTPIPFAQFQTSYHLYP